MRAFLIKTMEEGSREEAKHEGGKKCDPVEGRGGSEKIVVPSGRRWVKTRPVSIHGRERRAVLFIRPDNLRFRQR